MLVKTKTGNTKGRDNYGRHKLPKQLEQTTVHLVKKEKQLIDENEAIYGIGYLNPAFDDNQSSVINTPESSPIDVPHRSRKSSSKSEKVKARIVDVSRTVKRKLDMSSVPDVVQTSQPQVQIDDDLPSPSSDISDVHITDEDEFFLSKNSKLFSQVSSNTLTATESKTFNACAEQNPFRVVEVKEMEIVKSVASPEDHVILPSANVSVGLVPQVVERVEIIEDTETEPESIDTDTEDKEGRGKLSSAASIAEQIVNNKKKDLVPILKKKTTVEPSSARNIKRLVLKLDLDTDQEIVASSNKSQQTTSESKPTIPTWKDTESVAEYLILDDNDEIDISSMRNRKEVTSQKNTEYKRSKMQIGAEESASTVSHSEVEKLCKKSPLLKRSRNLSRDDTLEDCESFYGSDKETDDVLIFSDDTEIDGGSSSSDGEDINLREHVEHLLDKVTYVSHMYEPLIAYKHCYFLLISITYMYVCLCFICARGK